MGQSHYVIITLISLVILFAFITHRIARVKKIGLHNIIQLFRQSRFTEAKTHTEQYLKAFPNSKEAWVVLGNIGLETNSIDLSRRAYKEAYRIAPNYDKALIGLGVTYRMNQEFDKAEEFYYKALKINPNNSAAKSSLMLLELYKGNYPTAISLGEDSIKSGLEKVEKGILGNLAIAYHLDGKKVKRDHLVTYLKSIEYANLYYILLIIEGKMTLEEILETKM